MIRVALDIGGVISKYPGVIRAFARALVSTGQKAPYRSGGVDAVSDIAKHVTDDTGPGRLHKSICPEAPRRG